MTDMTHDGEGIAARRQRAEAAGEAMRARVIAQFAPGAEALGLTPTDETRTRWQGEFVDVTFGFPHSAGAIRSSYGTVTISVGGRGVLLREVPTVAYKVQNDREAEQTPDKVRKAHFKVADYNVIGADLVVTHRETMARAQADTALVNTGLEQHFGDFEGVGRGRTVSVKGRHPEADLLVTAAIKTDSTGGSREVCYTVRCDDRLTGDEARRVADLYLEMRVARRGASGGAA